MSALRGFVETVLAQSYRETCPVSADLRRHLTALDETGAFEEYQEQRKDEIYRRVVKNRDLFWDALGDMVSAQLFCQTVQRLAMDDRGYSLIKAFCEQYAEKITDEEFQKELKELASRGIQ